MYLVMLSSNLSLWGVGGVGHASPFLVPPPALSRKCKMP